MQAHYKPFSLFSVVVVVVFSFSSNLICPCPRRYQTLITNYCHNSLFTSRSSMQIWHFPFVGRITNRHAKLYNQCQERIAISNEKYNVTSKLCASIDYTTQKTTTTQYTLKWNRNGYSLCNHNRTFERFGLKKPNLDKPLLINVMRSNRKTLTITYFWLNVQISLY